MTPTDKILNVQSKKLNLVGVIIAVSVALIFGTFMLQYADCGIKSRTLAWVDIPDNVVQGYKSMYQSCHNIFGQDYTHNFDDLLQFYPSLQSWRNSQ